MLRLVHCCAQTLLPEVSISHEWIGSYSTTPRTTHAITYTESAEQRARGRLAKVSCSSCRASSDSSDTSRTRKYL